MNNTVEQAIIETRPDVHTYEDFRVFLRDFFAFKKFEEPTFSYRVFNQRAGVSSPNYLKLIIEGKRGLGIKNINNVAKGLGLTRSETEFFTLLVNFDQASTVAEKKKQYDRIRRNKHYREVKQLESYQYEFFSKWYIAPVREIISHKNFKEDPEWISKAIKPHITPKQAEEAIDLLLKMHIVERDENGKLVQCEGAIRSAPRVYSFSLATFHQQMLTKASESIDSMAADIRDITALTLSLKSRDLVRLKKMIADFRKQALSTLEVKSEDFERIYQLQISLFPLTDNLDEKE
jgi:uncharacterized protein (TIGR02147 family)